MPAARRLWRTRTAINSASGNALRTLTGARHAGRMPDAWSVRLGPGPQLDRVRGGEQHRGAAARLARRRPLLAQDDRRPRPAGVELGRELGGDLARHPARLLAARKSTAIAFGSCSLPRHGGAPAGSPARARPTRARPRGGGPRPPRRRRAAGARRARARCARGRRRSPGRSAGIRRATPGRHRRGTSSARRARRRWICAFG